MSDIDADAWRCLQCEEITGNPIWCFDCAHASPFYPYGHFFGAAVRAMLDALPEDVIEILRDGYAPSSLATDRPARSWSTVSQEIEDERSAVGADWIVNDILIGNRSQFVVEPTTSNVVTPDVDLVIAFEAAAGARILGVEGERLAADDAYRSLVDTAAV